NDELRVLHVARGSGGDEEAEQRPVRPQHARQLRRKLLRRSAIEIVHDVPAQDAVYAGVVHREALREKRRQILELAIPDVAIDVGEDIFDENLAAELFTEKADVAADDRTEVEQHRGIAGGQAGEKFSQSFGREDGIVGDSLCAEGMRFKLALARRDAVEQAHVWFGVRGSGFRFWLFRWFLVTGSGFWFWVLVLGSGFSRSEPQQ